MILIFDLFQTLLEDIRIDFNIGLTNGGFSQNEQQRRSTKVERRYFYVMKVFFMFC